MSLSAGEKLGPYEILTPIGAGGMGEVYRARDPRLARDVAVKVSAERFSERFEREARVIASLNHPNICTLFDVGPNYLVMELVEGPTLADRIREGAIPLDEALGIAKQMADALDAAHEKGVVHRDLKPGNVKFKPDGTVKVLDFGLAKTGDLQAAASDNSPTLTMAQTEAGVILGTASYMAPEQAKGKPVDKRADIYAFGVVLYEMLAGKRLHQGETTTEILASVLKEEPKWDKVPPQVHRLLHRCLEKDPQKRLRHIGDVMSLIDEGAGRPSQIAPPSRKVWVAVAAVTVILAAAVIWWAPWRGQANLQPVRFEIQALRNPGSPSLSPDGRWLAFAATGPDNVTRMWLRSLDSVALRPLPGTEGPGIIPPPFWSPDSKSIAFSSTPATNSPGQLKKLDISGGAPQTICDIPSSVPGGAWNRDGVILFATNTSELMKVSAAGGVVTPITVLDTSRHETAHRYPQFLPDGHRFLYHRTSTDAQYTGIYVGSLDAKAEQQSAKPLLLTDRQAVYSPPTPAGPRRLVFLRDTTLFAQSFDPASLELSGDAVPVADQVGSFSLANAGFFSISDTGVLAYRMGASATVTQLGWLDLQGKPTGTVGDPGRYSNPAVSPDGTRIAVSQLDPQKGNSNIWVLDASRGTRLTFSSGRDDFPVWSPDGASIIFASNRNGRMDIYRKPADGSGEERLLLKTEEDKVPTSWSRDGRYLLYTNNDPKTRADLWVLPLQGEAKPTLFLRTEFRERYAHFSPDGRWIAYASNETGTDEIYVRPFTPNSGGDSASGARWMASKGGGSDPRWRGDGKQLFYTKQLDQMAVDVSADKIFQAGAPTRLFAGPGLLYSPDVTPDGKRFLFISLEDTPNSPPSYTVVLNWQAALKK